MSAPEPEPTPVRNASTSLRLSPSEPFIFQLPAIRGLRATPAPFAGRSLRASPRERNAIRAVSRAEAAKAAEHPCRDTQDSVLGALFAHPCAHKVPARTLCVFRRLRARRLVMCAPSTERRAEARWFRASASAAAECLADRFGEAVRDGADLVAVFALDHDADHRLGSRRAQHHAATLP